MQKFNEYEVKLEKKSFEMISLQQPVSQDLDRYDRLKAVSDLERMGTMQYPSPKLPPVDEGGATYPAVEEEIKRWARCQKLRRSSPELYLNGSVDQAYEVAAMDEKSTIILIASVIWLQKKSRKIQSHRYRS